MKRLVFLLALLVVAIGFVQSQEIAIAANKNYAAYTTETAVSGTTVSNMDVKVETDRMYFYDVQWAADSAGDGTDFSLQLQGSNDESNYYSIGSAVTWAVSETDTIVQFTNYPSSETWTVAQYIATTAAKEDYHAYDSATGVATTWVDTVTVAAAVETVAAQTYTIAKQYPVGWRFLRIAATGQGSSAGCSITSFTVAIKRD